MPELPEVETTRRGVAPHIEGQKVSALRVRNPKLRWPVPDGLERILLGQELKRVNRRAKYLLFEFESGQLMVHLGMSGSLRLVENGVEPGKHDHFDLQFDAMQLRLRDPRRFGSIHWLPNGEGTHWLLAKLGPEPLTMEVPSADKEPSADKRPSANKQHSVLDKEPSPAVEEFNADYLFKQSRKKQVAVKNFIMDNHVVVGVGNIYASEALFRAGIRPTRAAGSISKKRYIVLVEEIKQVLSAAIRQGGTTLRDFVGGTGESGYFALELQVYGREGEPCTTCKRPLKGVRLGQRATVYCSSCQS